MINPTIGNFFHNHHARQLGRRKNCTLIKTRASRRRFLREQAGPLRLRQENLHKPPDAEPIKDLAIKLADERIGKEETFHAEGAFRSWRVHEHRLRRWCPEAHILMSVQFFEQRKRLPASSLEKQST